LLLAAGELIPEIAPAFGEPREQLVDISQLPASVARGDGKISSTLSEGKISRSCATQPMPPSARRCGGSRVMSPPRQRMRPRPTRV